MGLHFLLAPGYWWLFSASQMDNAIYTVPKISSEKLSWLNEAILDLIAKSKLSFGLSTDSSISLLRYQALSQRLEASQLLCQLPP